MLFSENPFPIFGATVLKLKRRINEIARTAAF